MPELLASNQTACEQAPWTHRTRSTLVQAVSELTACASFPNRRLSRHARRPRYFILSFDQPRRFAIWPRASSVSSRTAVAYFVVGVPLSMEYALFLYIQTVEIATSVSCKRTHKVAVHFFVEPSLQELLPRSFFDRKCDRR